MMSIASLAPPSQAMPPLPDPSPERSGARILPAGCYLISYAPADAPLLCYDGTLRVTGPVGQMIASGDLYQREIVPDEKQGEVLGPAPDPAAGIPIFPLLSYRHYLRIGAIEETIDGFRLAFDVHNYSRTQFTLFDGRQTAWPNERALTASMHRERPPPGYPPPHAFFAGEVKNEAGAVLGRLSMGWISPFLRKGTIEIDRVRESGVPLDNGAGVTWRSIFEKIGWDITVNVSDSDVVAPVGGVWTPNDGHAAMAARREKTDLNAEWRYHILGVQQISNKLRGHMYDQAAGGVNKVPREGLYVASHWQVPDQPTWGSTRGKLSGETVIYFRTAVHEFGHALGLDHNDKGVALMRTTDQIADDGTPERPFPDNIQWSFAPEDEHRLQHWSDMMVRPGGAQLDWAAGAPLERFESRRHRLEVTPVLAAVPLGAPVRVELRLINTSAQGDFGPADLSLSSRHVRGQVIDAQGTVRAFAAIAIDEREKTAQFLPAGAAIEGSLTLPRGGQGELFAAPGDYRVLVEASWTVHGLDFFAVGATRVSVTPEVDTGEKRHA
jgi:hypothetical protein